MAYKDKFTEFYNDGTMMTLSLLGIVSAVALWSNRGAFGGRAFDQDTWFSQYEMTGSTNRPSGGRASRGSRGVKGSGNRSGSRASSYQAFTSRTMKKLIAQGFSPSDAMRESARLWRAKTGR